MTKKIIKFLEAQVGKPYRLGARGPNLFDCSGLTKRAAEIAGYNWFHGATTQWKRGFEQGEARRYGYWADSGTIDTLPHNKLSFLFNEDENGRMAHTGVYTGDGYVIQAGGYGGRGVHRNLINKKRWTHWATLKGVDEEMKSGLRIGDRGYEVEKMQKLLVAEGYQLKPTKGDRKYGIDGKFGADTERIVRQFQQDRGLAVNGVWGEAEEKIIANTLDAGNVNEEKIENKAFNDLNQNKLTEVQLLIKKANELLLELIKNNS